MEMDKKRYYYDRISELAEAEDFRRVIKKWDILSDRMGHRPNVPIVLPDLFWVTKSGVGKTNLLQLVSEYLSECGNLIEFCGNVKFFEFMLDYYPPERSFPEIHRMIGQVKNAAGFRNMYKGIVSIDIDEWLGHCEEKHFISFLEYLSGNSDDWLIVFNVVGDKEDEVRQLESILSMYFRLERSVLSYPGSESLAEFVKQRLLQYGVTLDEGAAALCRTTIEKLKENRYFDGYKTLIILCQDIVYEIYSNEKNDPTWVTAEMLSRFAPDSDYIKRATWKAESKRRIGLIGGQGV